MQGILLLSSFNNQNNIKFIKKMFCVHDNSLAGFRKITYSKSYDFFVFKLLYWI